MNNPQRGEVWLVDLGLAAKVRPCLVFSITPRDDERALYTLVPHTTSARGTRFEANIPCNFLREGAFDAQNLLTAPQAKLMRKLGSLSSKGNQVVESAVRLWLAL